MSQWQAEVESNNLSTNLKQIDCETIWVEPSKPQSHYKTIRWLNLNSNEYLHLTKRTLNYISFDQITCNFLTNTLVLTISGVDHEDFFALMTSISKIKLLLELQI